MAGLRSCTGSLGGQRCDCERFLFQSRSSSSNWAQAARARTLFAGIRLPLRLARGAAIIRSLGRIRSSARGGRTSASVLRLRQPVLRRLKRRHSSSWLGVLAAAGEAAKQNPAIFRAFRASAANCRGNGKRRGPGINSWSCGIAPPLAGGRVPEDRLNRHREAPLLANANSPKRTAAYARAQVPFRRSLR